MLRFFAIPYRLVLLLAFGTAISVVSAAVSVVQVSMGWVPDDSLRLMVAPIAFFIHSLAGVVFGITGPLQFSRILQRRFGRAHKITGRLFAAGGIGLGLSALAFIAQVDSKSTALIDIFRGLAGLGVVLAVTLGISAARARDFVRHRAWMIRAYAIGMGPGAFALVMFPIYVITGAPIFGLASDILFVASWSLSIAVGEWVVRQGAAPRTVRTLVAS